jgi:hypothetical protein
VAASVLKVYSHALWLAGLGFHSLLVVVLLAKRTWTKFPAFLTYACFGAAAGWALYVVRTFPFLYFYGYWVCEGIGILLGLGVLYEVFRSLLKSYTGLHRVANVTFPLTIVLLIVLSCLVVYAQPSAERNPLVSAILVGEEASRVVEIGLLLFLFIFSTTFGLHWRQQVFGIALGLGLFVAVELIAITARTRFGIAASGALIIARATAFDLSLLTWIGYLLLPERVPHEAELPKRTQLEQWNHAIMELINQ